MRVFYLDYGFSRVFDNIREVSAVTTRTNTELTSIPPLALQCALSQVNPSAISCFDSSWSKRAIDYFKKYVSKRNTFTGMS